MKLLKIIMWTLAGLLLLVVVAVTVFALTFDANQYKGLITEQVKQQTGRELNIEGDIALTVFPWLGVELGRMTLANASGYADPSFARLEQLAIKVEILPLLKAELSVDKVRVKGLVLSLHQKADGSNNWDDLSRPEKAPADKPSKDKAQGQAADSVSESPFAALMINGLEIRDAALHWRDDVTGQQLRLDRLVLETGTIELAEDVPVSLSAHAQLNQPQADVSLSLETQANFDLDSMQLALKQLAIKLDSKTPGLMVQQSQLSLETEVMAQLKPQQYVIKDLSIELTSSGQDLPGGQLSLGLKTAVQVDLAKQTAALTSIQLKTLGLVVSGNAKVESLLDQPVASGQIKLAEFNPSLLPSQLGISLPSMSDPRVLQKAGLRFDYIAGTASAAVENFVFTLDDSRLRGRVQVSDFSKPEISYQLHLDRIDIDRYLPAPSTTTADEKPTDQAPVASDIAIELPLDLLRTLQVDGVFKMGKLQAFNQQLSALAMTVEGRQGVIRVTPMTATFLKGQLELAAKLDVRNPLPQYAMDFNARRLQAAPAINPILKNMMGKDAVKIDGSANVSANVTSQGASVNQLMQGLNGKFNLNVGEASLEGVDTEYFVRKIAMDYMQEKNWPVSDHWRGEYQPKETTAFRVIRATGSIRNGVISNNDLLLDSKPVKITGAGKVNLPSRSINYRTVVDLQPPRKKTVAEKLLDVPVPVITRGPFSGLNIKPDISAWRKSAGKVAKKEVKRKVDEKKEKLKKKYEDKLKDKFKGMLR